MPQMEMTYDFLVCLDNDLGLIIMGFLNVIDVIRAATVSKTWRRFVIANGLCKKIFLKRFPLPRIAHIKCEIEGIFQSIQLSDVLTMDVDWGALERDHRIYSSLLQPLATPMYLPRDCLLYPIGASSTRNIEEHILNTINPVDEYPGGRLFWSSEGEVKPDVPVYMTYKLLSNMGIVTEVKIRPYEASSEPENPIYSPTSVRFRFGYLRFLNCTDKVYSAEDHPTFDEYNWTYTSPEFPMTQEAGLHQFKLPEPIVCVGGVVQIELLGRVQKNPNDGLFYIRLGYVQIMGLSIHPAYVLNMLKNGELRITFYPRVLDSVLRRFRHDPKDPALLWRVSIEEMNAPRPFVQDWPLVGQDLRFTEELHEEAISSSA